MKTPTIKAASAAVISACSTVVFVVVTTIAGELFPSFKAWLAATFSHHWLGKSILAIIFFLLIWVLAYFAKKDENENEVSLVRWINLLSGLVVVCALVLFGFFAFEALK